MARTCLILLGAPLLGLLARARPASGEGGALTVFVELEVHREARWEHGELVGFAGGRLTLRKDEARTIGLGQEKIRRIAFGRKPDWWPKRKKPKTTDLAQLPRPARPARKAPLDKPLDKTHDKTHSGRDRPPPARERLPPGRHPAERARAHRPGMEKRVHEFLQRHRDKREQIDRLRREIVTATQPRLALGKLEQLVELYEALPASQRLPRSWILRQLRPLLEQTKDPAVREALEKYFRRKRLEARPGRGEKRFGRFPPARRRGMRPGERPRERERARE